MLKLWIENESRKPIVEEQFDKLKKCWEKLELEQETFLSTADIDIETHKDGLSFIDEPNTRYNEAVNIYSTYMKTSEELERVQFRQKETEDRDAEQENRMRIEATAKEEEERLRLEQLKLKFDSATAELSTSIDAFKRMSLNVKDSLGEASVSSKQSEWQKIEKEFSTLKNQLSKVAGIDGRQDMSDINKQFIDEAEMSFIELQKWMMLELKDVPVPGKPVESEKKGIVSSTRSEKVKHPEFKGDEKESPYLTYPIWRKQWDLLIAGYDEYSHATFLYDKLDATARSKFIGYENDYTEAMNRLEKFYANHNRIVSCVMKEVNSPREISDGDSL